MAMPTKAESTMGGRQKGASAEHPPRRAFPFPPADFDPIGALPSDLAEYGLPQRPDGDRHPGLLKAWLRLFERPLVFRRHPQQLERDVRQLIEEPTIRQVRPDKTRFKVSSNWCGASIVPNGGKQFVLMFGEWTVPTPELPPPSERGPAGETNEYHCSTWIGLDGNRRYRNATLPQIGTEHILAVDQNGGQTARYFAWFQWWARDQVALTRKTLSNIEVASGVSVMAMISVIDPHHVVMVLRTFAPRNEITILVEETPEVWLTPAKTSKIRPVISGATAEWILERPETLDLDNPKPELFAKYNPVRFRHCVAGMARAPGSPTSEETLSGARFFRLREVPAAPPPRTRLISMPTLIGTSSIEVRYGGFPD
jgi:peptidase A4-like protein